VTVSPPPTLAAPINVQPIVTVVVTDPHDGCLSPACDVVEHAQIRSAPTRARASQVIEARVERLQTIQFTTLRIVPLAPLSPNRRYEIRGFSVWPLQEPERGRLLGTFRTGSYTDSAGPTWSGPARADAHSLAGPLRAARRGQGVISLPVGPEQIGPAFDVFGPTPVDDHTSPSSLRYAVWQAGDDGSIDYRRPPTAILAHEPKHDTEGRLFVAGAENECMRRAFPFPATGRYRVGIKVLDLAGNASSPGEVTIDFGGAPNKGRR